MTHRNMPSPVEKTPSLSRGGWPKEPPPFQGEGGEGMGKRVVELQANAEPHPHPDPLPEGEGIDGKTA